MKCTFYRPETINTEEWNNIRSKLRADLEELETGKVPESEVVLYLETLFSQAEPLEKNPAMRFFGFDKPEHMPSDARVEYYYWPTYIAAALGMKACLLFPGSLGKVELPEMAFVDISRALSRSRSSSLTTARGSLSSSARFPARSSPSASRRRCCSCSPACREARWPEHGATTTRSAPMTFW